MTSKVTLTVNGKERSADVEPRTLLAEMLRDHLGLTGTHVGCDTTQCGCCVVHVDGKAVKSCTMLAVQANGKQVTTIHRPAMEGRYRGIIHHYQVSLEKIDCAGLDLVALIKTM